MAKTLERSARSGDPKDAPEGFDFRVRMEGTLSDLVLYVPCRILQLDAEPLGPWRLVVVDIAGWGERYACIGEITDDNHRRITIKRARDAVDQAIAQAVEVRRLARRPRARED
jgi:hypothetical protein